jgi:hypothetical protein
MTSRRFPPPWSVEVLRLNSVGAIRKRPPVTLVTAPGRFAGHFVMSSP